ncbi:YbjN domain-containing protein [Cupriavidus sp. 2TAF22]|uniref:YbjN domain-containing protein n=1 Tax=unclassified Cupriavidus TaxID=2640874 RepID=UPI003F9372D8
MTEATPLDAAPETTSADSATPALLTHVTAGQVADAIRNAGCAVNLAEEDGTARLHSASHGVGFQVLWGNRVSNVQYLDFTLSCPLRVEGGQLPDALLNEWHRSRRFARIASHGDFLVLEMDVMVTGGVTEAYLSVAMQVWIQVMGQFFLHLRNYRAQARQDDVNPAATPEASAASAASAESAIATATAIAEA